MRQRSGAATILRNFNSLTMKNDYWIGRAEGSLGIPPGAHLQEKSTPRQARHYPASLLAMQDGSSTPMATQGRSSSPLQQTNTMNCNIPAPTLNSFAAFSNSANYGFAADPTLGPDDTSGDISST